LNWGERLQIFTRKGHGGYAQIAKKKKTLTKTGGVERGIAGDEKKKEKSPSFKKKTASI